MNISGLATSLYPMALASANIGIGAGLYTIGAVMFAAALWIAGAFVVVGILVSIGLMVAPPRTKKV